VHLDGCNATAAHASSPCLAADAGAKYVAPNSEDEWAAFQQSVQGDIEAIDKQVEEDEVRS
jgi:hypothetical protein